MGVNRVKGFATGWQSMKRAKSARRYEVQVAHRLRRKRRLSSGSQSKASGDNRWDKSTDS